MRSTLMALMFSLLSLGFAQAQELDVGGCSENSYVRTNANFVQIDTTRRFTYRPRCLEVRRGTMVRIDASFFHPLQGIGDLGNPIVNPRGPAMSPKMFRFNKSGVFGYYCPRHGNSAGQGMAGAIRVLPW